MHKERFWMNRRFPRVVLGWMALILVAIVPATRAAVRFDVIVGYSGIAPQGAWYPLTCELNNTGPSFTGVIEVSDDRIAQQATRRLKIELPSNTTKRVIIPDFSAIRYNNPYIRLLDEKGRLVAEPNFVGSQRVSGYPILGYVSRAGAGVPGMPEIKWRNTELQPLTVRLQPELFPDNPLVLDGIPNLYLNSERAAALTEPQVAAILAWLQHGGHLIIGVEQIGDLTSKEWLRDILPFDPVTSRVQGAHVEIQAWIKDYLSKKGTDDASASQNANQPQRPAQMRVQARNAPPRAAPRPKPAEEPIEVVDDSAFESAGIPVVTGTLRDGKILLGSNDTPLAIQASRGCGKITVLTFSPEREPFLSWKHRAWFWARLAGVNPNLYKEREGYSGYGYLSTDGVIGSLIDSKQVRKLPLTWLLALLGAYLVIIGPLDQYILKRAKRQMLTWITFPIYVVGFSGLIYFIGFYLRAGDLECNELTIVDILPSSQLKAQPVGSGEVAVDGDTAVLRGQSYCSVYSPANSRYAFRGTQTFAAFRGEFVSVGRGQGSRTSVSQRGNGFDSEGFVPVWTSQLFVSDWLEPGELPLRMTITPSEKEWRIRIENRTDHKLTTARIVLGQRIYDLGELPRGISQFTRPRGPGQGRVLLEFISSQGDLVRAAQNRHSSFRGETYNITDVSAAAIAASFPSLLSRSQNDWEGLSPARALDLAPFAEQGHAILMVWDENQNYTKPIKQFTARRSRSDTLLRLVVPMPKTPTSGGE